MTDWLILLAQSATSKPDAGASTMMWQQMIGIFLVVGVFWFMMSRGRRKEQQRYQDMLNNLKKNDRVQTIGGVIGTVVEVRDNEVVLKVDESSNVKMRFVRNAIKDVLREAAAPVETNGKR